MSLYMRNSDGSLGRRVDGGLALCPGCNDCDPPLKCVYKVTLSGLAGDFAQFNGENIVKLYSDYGWEGQCYWVNATAAPRVILFHDGERWRVHASVAGGGYTWSRPTAGTCEPAGTYDYGDCSDTGCVDPDSCEDSIGATCVVSEVSA